MNSRGWPQTSVLVSGNCYIAAGKGNFENGLSTSALKIMPVSPNVSLAMLITGISTKQPVNVR